MSSDAPPRRSTKYEDIPPRFRKVWIKGHKEKIQKKLDAPIDEFSFSMPIQHSRSDIKTSESGNSNTSKLSSEDTPSQASSSSIPTIPLSKRPRTSESAQLGISESCSGEGGLVGNEREALSTPLVYTGPSSMRHIIDSVVAANRALSTPPASRSNSPPGELNPLHRSQRGPRSRPLTRTNSPASRPRSSTPSGWEPLTSRHSLRRFDIRPWGPRHLEYDYHQARKEFQAAAYYALGQYGYEPPKGVVKYKPPPPKELPSMSDLRKVPIFAKACRKLDAADRLLEEALARGETWDNTPIPREHRKLSLENAAPEELCVRRSDNAVIQDRSRSSVTLEEATGHLKPSFLNRSSVTPTSVPTSASPSEGGSESVPDDEARSSHGISSVLQTTLLGEKLALPTPPSTHDSLIATTVADEASKTPGANTNITTFGDRPSPISQSQSARKRMYDEIENEAEIIKGSGDSKRTESTEIETHHASPRLLLKVSEKADSRSLGRTQSESTSISGALSSVAAGGVSRESPPTSVASDSTKVTTAEGNVRGGGRGRPRGRGRGRPRGRGRARGIVMGLRGRGG